MIFYWNLDVLSTVLFKSFISPLLTSIWHKKGVATLGLPSGDGSPGSSVVTAVRGGSSGSPLGLHWYQHSGWRREEHLITAPPMPLGQHWEEGGESPDSPLALFWHRLGRDDWSLSLLVRWQSRFPMWSTLTLRRGTGWEAPHKHSVDGVSLPWYNLARIVCLKRDCSLSVKKPVT